MCKEPTPLRISVDGEVFIVVEGPSVAHFSWVTGPNEGYGFSVGFVGVEEPDREQLESAVRNFLEQIDPNTGYIGS